MIDRMDERRGDEAAMQSLFDETALAPGEESLERMTTRAALRVDVDRRSRSRWRWRLLALAAAVVAVVGIALAGGWLTGPKAPEADTRETVAATDTPVKPAGPTDEHDAAEELEEDEYTLAVATYMDVGWSDQDALGLELLDHDSPPPPLPTRR